MSCERIVTRGVQPFGIGSVPRTFLKPAFLKSASVP